MGCASSSPLVNGGGPGGLVDSVKTAATDGMTSEENAMHGKYELHNEKIHNNLRKVSTRTWKINEY